MRTYKRKRPVYQEIEDVIQLCRLCLNKAEDPVPLFSEEDGNNSIRVPFAHRIMMCVGHELIKDDCLPNSICKNCSDLLEKFYAFRKRCENTYQKLKSHLLSIRDKETQKALEFLAKADDSMKTKNFNGLTSPVQKQSLLIPSNLNRVNSSSLSNVVTIGNLDDKDKLMNILKTISIKKEVSNKKIKKKQKYESNSNILRESDNHQIIVVNKDESMNVFKLEGPEKTLVDQQNKLKAEERVETDKGSTCTDNVQAVKQLPSSEFTYFLKSLLIDMGAVTEEEDNHISISDSEVNRLNITFSNGNSYAYKLVEEDDETESPEDATNKEENTEEVKLVENLVNCVQKTKSTDAEDVETIINTIKDERSGLQCGLCLRVFATASSLSRHASVHSGHRPYPCHACGRRYTQRAVLARHQRTYHGTDAVNGEKRLPAPKRALYACSLCPKMFLYASGLSRHTGTHLGRVYTCMTCERQYSDYSAFNRHLATHEPVTQTTSNQLKT